MGTNTCACVSTPCLAPIQKFGERAPSPLQPHCVSVCIAHACIVPTPGICLLSQSHQPEPSCHLPALSKVKDVTQRQARDVFLFLHCFQKRRRGWPFPRGQLVAGEAARPHPGRVVHDPQVSEGCCHGGLCGGKFLQGEVGEIFIPRVRQRERGQRPRAGEPGYYGHSEAVVCGAGGPWAFPGCLNPWQCLSLHLGG